MKQSKKLLPGLLSSLCLVPILLGMGPCGSMPTYNIEVVRLTSDCGGETRTTLVVDPDPRSQSVSLDPLLEDDDKSWAIEHLAIDDWAVTVTFASGIDCRVSSGGLEAGACYDRATGNAHACQAQFEHVAWRMPTYDDGFDTPQVLQAAEAPH